MDQPTARNETVTAFVGRALRGPVNTPIKVDSFADYQRIFGGLWQPSSMSYAVEHFFEQGGQNLFIVRLANGARAATISLCCGTEALVLEALTPGSREFLRAAVDYDNIGREDIDSFNLVVQRVRTAGSEHIEEQETYRRISISPATQRFITSALTHSKLVRVRGQVPQTRPELTLNVAASHLIGYKNSNTDGHDGAPLSDYDVIGSALDGTGIFSLASLEKLDLLYIPPLTRDTDVGVSTLLVAVRFCRERQAMLIVDPPATWGSSKEALSGVQELNFFSDQAVLFFPRILSLDRLRGRNEIFGNGGAIAGMIARADSVRPVWAVHRSEPEFILRPNMRMAVELNEADRWRLANNGINTLRQARSPHAVRLLTRTLAGGINATADWGYLTTRRFALFVVRGLAQGTRWVALSPSKHLIAARVVRQVNGFLQSLLLAGAFPAARPGRAFFIICDERINTQTQSDEFNILVGFVASRADEYHSFMITHSMTGTTIKPAAVNQFETSNQYLDESVTSQLNLA